MVEQLLNWILIEWVWSISVTLVIFRFVRLKNNPNCVIRVLWLYYKQFYFVWEIQFHMDDKKKENKIKNNTSISILLSVILFLFTDSSRIWFFYVLHWFPLESNEMPLECLSFWWGVEKQIIEAITQFLFNSINCVANYTYIHHIKIVPFTFALALITDFCFYRNWTS